MNVRAIVFFISFIPLLAACVSGDGSAAQAESCASASNVACSSTPPTYATDVAPLLETYCNDCHGPGGEESNRPLTSYSAVKQMSGDLERDLSGCSMPPSDDDQPTAAERDAVLEWIACGAAND